MATPLVPDAEILPTSRNPRLLSRATPHAEAFAQTGEYSILGLTRAADQAVVRERQVGFTLVAVRHRDDHRAAVFHRALFLQSPGRRPGRRWRRLVPAELIFTYAWALLTPLVMFSAKRFPVWGRQRRRHWLIQLGAMLDIRRRARGDLFARHGRARPDAHGAHRCRSCSGSLCCRGRCSTRWSFA